MARAWTPSQQAAMEIGGKTLLVSAAAGSGKTSVLTERIIRSLLDKDSPADLSRMLIVTFTRAAAAELKGRIAEALTEALAQNPGDPHLSNQLFLLGSAQISTIDSFFQKAVRENFEQLEIPANFRPADEGELLPIKNEILDGLIEKFYRENEPKEASRLFGEIYENPFAIALDNLISNRSDGKLNSLLLDFHAAFSADPRGIGAIGDAAALLRTHAKDDFLRTPPGEEMRVYMEELFTSYKTTLEATERHLDACPDMKKRYAAVVESDQLLTSSLLEALGTGYAEVREALRAFSTVRLPGGKIDKTDEILFYIAKRTKFKARIKKVCEMTETPPEQIPLQAERTASLLETLHSLLSEYEARLWEQKCERGIFEYDDVRAMLYRLLTLPDGSRSPFAASLAAKYTAVYIDEYQDVDLLQDRIFDAIGQDRRFMVGDIKQSIYGFRGSDPSIFSSYRRAFPLHTDASAEDADGVCVFMSENFRCNKPVIDFANRICAFLFSACEESVGYKKEDDLAHSKRDPEHPRADYPAPVRLAVFDAPPRSGAFADDEDETEDEEDVREEALWVASEISRLLREEKLDDGTPITPDKIAILVRNRNQGKRFCDALTELQIPVNASAQSDVLFDPILSATVNLLRAIDNPYRDLPLSELLLSPLCGYTLEELDEIHAAGGDADALCDAMEARAAAPDALGNRLTETLAWLETERKRASVLSADRFLRLLYLNPRLRPYAETPALLFLYDRARASQKAGFCGLYAFLSQFSKLMEDGKASADGFSKAVNAVTVMTVHHSKGLEFPTVFLCGTGTQFNKDDLKKTLLYHPALGCGAKLYDPITGNAEETALHAALKLRVDLEGTEENIRTLYVALTRARERLYVTGTLRGKWENTLTNASLIEYGDRPAILGANNTLLWMLAALKNGGDGALPCELSHHPIGSVGRGVAIGVESPEEKAAPIPDGFLGECAEILLREKEFSYPYQDICAYPAKLAASKVRRGLLDDLEADGEEDYLDLQIEQMRSAHTAFDTLLSDKKRADAAEIGTATHAFLELCDFRLLYEGGVEAESERLLNMELMNEHALGLVDKKRIEAFRQSRLMQLLLSCTWVRREQHFGITLPLASLAKDPTLAAAVGENGIFVQGSIDLLIQTADGKLILVDYKTDRLTDGERRDPARLALRMEEAHGAQLAVYAKAIEELFGRAPDEMLIYSVPLGDTVPVSPALRF